MCNLFNPISFLKLIFSLNNLNREVFENNEIKAAIVNFQNKLAFKNNFSCTLTTFSS